MAAFRSVVVSASNAVASMLKSERPHASEQLSMRWPVLHLVVVRVGHHHLDAVRLDAGRVLVAQLAHAVEVDHAAALGVVADAVLGLHLDLAISSIATRSSSTCDFSSHACWRSCSMRTLNLPTSSAVETPNRLRRPDLARWWRLAMPRTGAPGPARTTRAKNLDLTQATRC